MVAMGIVKHSGADMPEKAAVTVRFGPYRNGSGVVEHRVSRLQGLRAVLVSGGHTVFLEEILDLDMVELLVNGETVFQCNIRELDFGGDGKMDPLCEEARQSVLKAY
ncbi:hypothetical protein GDO81_004282 [Engystomops pustulosus]|uniref:Uncharacterized protein n=1 Tax=Engystomops pustulosus TaxID=76066 RepID=A0AAV6ZRQ6_ENGPU|nr:hypothetical protein GDO81_004282 [Engystomops pustulosus]